MTARGLRARLVGEAEAPRARGRRRRAARRSRRAPRPLGQLAGMPGAAVGGQARAAGPQRPPVDRRAAPRARAAPRTRRGLGASSPRVGGRAHDRRASGMLGARARRAAISASASAPRSPSSVGDAGQPRRALGQRAGLVERDGLDAAEVLERLAALDQHAAARGAADRRDDADRHRDHQRARAGDDQQRERPVDPRVDVAAEQRRDDRDEQRGDEDQRRVDAREAVDEALGRRLAALRLGDELGDARERRVRRRRVTRTVSAPCGVQRAGEDRVAGLLVDRAPTRR